MAALTYGSAASRLLSQSQSFHSGRLAPPLAHPAGLPGQLWPERPLVSVIWLIRLWREARVGERGSEALRSRPEPWRTGSAPS